MNPASSDNLSVRHNPAASRFEVDVGGVLAVADYVLTEGRVVFTHTFVPPALRGRGIAEKLVLTALEWSKAEGYRVEPQCSYVAAFIERHAEYQALVG